MMDNRDNLDVWIADLDSRDPEVRYSAIKRLEAMGTEAVESLIVTMQNQTGRKAWEAVSILSHIDDSRWMQPMKDMLTESNTMIATLAASALERFGTDIVDVFIDALPKCRCLAQMQIIIILERIGDERCTLPLMDLLLSTDSCDLQHTVIHALGILGDGRAIELIRTFQNHENHHVRKRAQATLKQLEDKINE
ncbi:MAG: HEAT repeat domain-containing protein [Chloroflexota bacterium]